MSDYAALHAYDEELVRRHEAALVGAPILAFCGLNTLPGLRLGAVRDLFRRARGRGVRTVLDTGWDPSGWPAGRLAALREVLGEVSVFLPNRDEAEAITGHSDPARAARALREMGVEMAVVKLGPEGSFALGGWAGRSLGTAGEGGAAVPCEESLPALAVDVLDAVGAGDVYVGGVRLSHVPQAGPAGVHDPRVRRGQPVHLPSTGSIPRPG